MHELKTKNYHGKQVVDSRDVAEMVEKRHYNLLRDIDGYVETMNNSTKLKIEVSDFFIPHTYQDKAGRTLPCYLVTKKGCDMIANKLTGKKGVLFTAAYVTAFEDMRKRQADFCPLSAPPRVQLPDGVSLSGLAKLLNATRRVMLDMGSSPAEVGAVAWGLCASCGVTLHEAFVNQIPGQLSLFAEDAPPPMLAAD